MPTDAVLMKTCKTCDRTLPLTDEFWVHRVPAEKGWQAHCRECFRLQGLERTNRYLERKRWGLVGRDVDEPTQDMIIHEYRHGSGVRRHVEVHVRSPMRARLLSLLDEEDARHVANLEAAESRRLAEVVA